MLEDIGLLHAKKEESQRYGAAIVECTDVSFFVH